MSDEKLLQDTLTEQELSKEVHAKIEETLASVDQLSVDLADQATEIEALHTEAEEKDKALAEANEKLEELSKKVAEVTERAEKAEAKLQEIEEARLISDRMSFLKNNGVEGSTEEKLLKQAEKCKSMSDEEFKAYADELIDVKTRIEAAFKAKEEETETEENLTSQVEEIKASDEETAASVDEVDKKLKEILKRANLLNSEDPVSEKEAEEAADSEKEVKEASEETETPEEVEVAKKESASIELAPEALAKRLVECFTGESR